MFVVVGKLVIAVAARAERRKKATRGDSCGVGIGLGSWAFWVLIGVVGKGSASFSVSLVPVGRDGLVLRCAVRCRAVDAVVVVVAASVFEAWAHRGLAPGQMLA